MGKNNNKPPNNGKLNRGFELLGCYQMIGYMQFDERTTISEVKNLYRVP